MATGRREWIGSELRRLRGRLTSADVQNELGIKPTKLSRIEAGKVQPSTDDVRTLATYYGADRQAIERLTALTDNLKRPAWWTEYVGEDWDSALGYHLDLETEAVKIESWNNELVPGLLQVPSYIAALVTGRVDVPEEQLNRRLELRALRQRRVHSGELELWAVMSEVVLYLEVGGGQEVLSEQLQHLANPPKNVTVQILPFKHAYHSGLGSTFHMLHFPSWPAMVYEDTTLKGLYDDSPDTVQRHQRIIEDTRATALSPKASHALLTQRIAELKG